MKQLAGSGASSLLAILPTGGKDNFAADREAAQLALQTYPQLAQAV